MAEEKELTQAHAEKEEKSTHSEKKAKSENKSWLDYWHKFNNFLEKYLLKEAPAIPQKAKDIIVQILPVLILIGVVLSLIGLISVFVLGGAFLALGGLAVAGANTLGNFLSLILSLAATVLEIIALPGLFGKQKKGWQYMYYAMLVSLVGSVLSFNIFGVVFGVLFLYLTFQIKSMYK